MDVSSRRSHDGISCWHDRSKILILITIFETSKPEGLNLSDESADEDEDEDEEERSSRRQASERRTGSG